MTITNFYARHELRAARELAGLSQRDLAKRSGLSQATVAGLERRTVPVELTVALNEALAERLNGTKAGA